MTAIPPEPRSINSSLIWAIAACLLVTLPLLPLHNYLDPANIAMLYLLAVTMVAVQAGKRAAILAACLNVVLLDFFFIQPRFSFAIGDVQYGVTLAVMLAVALIISKLTTGLQSQATDAIERERQSRALYELASKLAGATSLEQMAAATRNFLHRSQGCRGVLLVRRSDMLQPVEPEHHLDSELQSAAAYTAMQLAQVRNLLEGNQYWMFLPLHGSTYVRGVLAIDFSATPQATINARQALYAAVASLAAIAVERLHFVEVAQRVQLQMTDERLRSAILAALSHDIRTPLTAIYGMADTLALMQLPQPARDSAEAMREQALWLNSMVENLLDMAKLNAGSIRLNQEWQPVEEVIGASIKLLGAALEHHPVKVMLPPDFPLLKFDAVLMERVLCNLLENAAKYSPPDIPVSVNAQLAGDKAKISVCDSGPGFPPDKLDKVFELFERGDTESSVPGVGLGLAICRSIVEAHGGKIHASNRDGACVTFTLPLDTPPVIETEDDE
ncbi:MAG: DUF4118 domain-containing protein [Nitrosomonadales bacterium]|nr:DUF4118 domain-containing protein [Nitrosomonadales bacterium]